MLSCENPCVASGCPGGCCGDITIYDTEETILRTFPDAQEVNVWKLQKIIEGNSNNGVFYMYDGRSPVPGMAIARISGPCPNKLENGNCGRYQRCSHASENFVIGSQECNEIRMKLGLKPV